MKLDICALQLVDSLFLRLGLRLQRSQLAVNVAS